MFKENLKKLRQSNKLSQQAVADSIGVNRVTYTRYENGERTPDPDMLKRIADFFKVSLDYLLERGIYAKKDWIAENRELVNDIIEQVFNDFILPQYDIQGVPEGELVSKFTSADIDTFLAALSPLIGDIKYDEEKNKYTVFFVDDGPTESTIPEDEIYYLDEGDKFMSKYPPEARAELEMFLSYLNHKYNLDGDKK